MTAFFFFFCCYILAQIRATQLDSDLLFLYHACHQTVCLLVVWQSCNNMFSSHQGAGCRLKVQLGSNRTDHAGSRARYQQKEVIALNRQGTQQQRPELSTLTPPGMRVNTEYMNCSRRQILKKREQTWGISFTKTAKAYQGRGSWGVGEVCI